MKRNDDGGGRESAPSWGSLRDRERILFVIKNNKKNVQILIYLHFFLFKKIRIPSIFYSWRVVYSRANGKSTPCAHLNTNKSAIGNNRYTCRAKSVSSGQLYRTSGSRQSAPSKIRHKHFRIYAKQSHQQQSVFFFFVCLVIFLSGKPLFSQKIFLLFKFVFYRVSSH